MERAHEWHLLAVSQVAGLLDTHAEQGLDEPEAARRLESHGPNRLPAKKAKPAWRTFLAQFESLLTLVLVAAGVLAGLIGDTTDMVVILAVVTFNAILGFTQEYRAERIIDTLASMLAQKSRVRRGGRKIEIPAVELVPGDLVLLEAGDRVPADGRLTACHSIEIDESSLTGESVAVAKDSDALPGGEDYALGDRANLAFMNTTVTRGRAEMLVTATGAETEMGRIAGLIEAGEAPRTPLQDRLDQLGRRLALIAGLVVAVILVMGLVRGEPLADLILTAVALAVAAIPEGLPAVVTVTLAIGMYRMARRGAIVRRLPAVETLGATTTICSDKTGTLTLNQMTATQVWTGGRTFAVAGLGYAPEGGIENAEAADLARLLRPAVSCNDSRLVQAEGAWRVVGDPTEGALLVLGAKAGVSDEGGDLPRLAEIPFDSAAKFMATLHGCCEDGHLLFVKGAPDVVLRLCTRVETPDGPVPMHDGMEGAVRAAIDEMGHRSLRVLALAERRLDEAVGPERLAAEVRELTLLALVGLLDPPRAEAREAVAACRRAGIAVKMVTGDHRATAAAIAADLGIEGEVLSGAELERMDDGELAERIEGIGVFARVAPEHKVRIVRALALRGHVTAMTGDGVNDAAALRAADIGVAMGRGGTDVTREAAAMVLTDDDFSTIVGAVREGRTIYDNIVSFVRFQLSTNIGALLSVFLAPLAGMPVPFHAIQILWVNIIMDGPPAMALAFDPPREGVMERRPRPRDEAILSGPRLTRLLAYGITMAAGTLGVFWHAQQTLPIDQARTLAFTTFVLFQFFNVFNARVGDESAIGPRALTNGKLWLALAGVVGLQAVAVHWGPAQALFHTADLTPGQWLLATLVASSVLVLDEGRKLASRLRARLRRR